MDAAASPTGRALSRHANSISRFDTRWLWGIAVVAPMMLSAGVYFLHRVPFGPQAASGMQTVEVRVVEQALPEPRPLARPNVAASAGRPEPMVDAPNRPIPEETTTAAYTPSKTEPTPAPERASTTQANRPQSEKSGAVSTFRSTLLSHIARFQNYPAAAKAGQHGIAQVVFRMRRDGSVYQVVLRTSSGHQVLDDAASDTIRRAQPLPRIPVDLPDTLTVLLPISFDPPL